MSGAMKIYSRVLKETDSHAKACQAVFDAGVETGRGYGGFTGKPDWHDKRLEKRTTPFIEASRTGADR